jgi:hypothetical protein
VFNNVVGQESYRGEHLGDLVAFMAQFAADVHRFHLMPDFTSAVTAPAAAG